MKKYGADPKVKKTLVRDCEQKIVKSSSKKYSSETVVNRPKDVRPLKSAVTVERDTKLDHPALCSSEVLANYIYDVKKTLPPMAKSPKKDKKQINEKVTKKLNFHFNDKIYKNLVELNANTDTLVSKRDKRPSSSAASVKRDLEPNIEDFYENEIERDSPLVVPVIKPKFKPVRMLDRGELHQLVASFENL